MAKYGRLFLCHNQGPFHMREVVKDGAGPRFIDAALSGLSPEAAFTSEWSHDQLISPDAPASEVRG